MALRKKTIKGKKYYYLDLSYFISNKSKTFSKYVGTKKPSESELAKIEQSFRTEIISKLSGKNYGTISHPLKQNFGHACKTENWMAGSSVVNIALILTSWIFTVLRKNWPLSLTVKYIISRFKPNMIMKEICSCCITGSKY